MAETAALAYSYIRFSTAEQMKGDSLRRQSELAEKWCERNGVTLDKTTTFRDLGRSAFGGEHRKNPDRHDLARFLKLVEDGRVPRGSFLIIENLDRLSREHLRPALTLLLGLIESGVRVVQLLPVEQVLDDKVEPMVLMMAIMELSRGHNESATKSKRNGESWDERRKAAREEGTTLTRQLPAWVVEKDGKRRLIPERAAVVRRIFALSIAGDGLHAIARKLTDERVEPFGPSGKWQMNYIQLILKDRRAVGELAVRRRGRADGEPIAGYFPAVVTEEVWQRSRLAAEGRRHRPGRKMAGVNIFNGLLRDARTGASYAAAFDLTGKVRRRIIRSQAIRSASGSTSTFPLDTLEAAVLARLRELDPRELLPPSDDASEALTLATELTAIKGRIAAIEAELAEEGDVAALARVLRGLEARKKDVAQRLATASQKAASPAADAWGDTRSILSALAGAAGPEDARTRLRSALRRLIESIWILVVKRGRDRLAAVQLFFHDTDQRRAYLILHRPPKANASSWSAGGWWARSLADAPAGLDLHVRDHALALAAELEVLDLDALTGEGETA